MKCCINCFHDIEIIKIINNNSQDFGKCDFCESESVRIVESQIFLDKFKELFEYFVIDSIHGESLIEVIQNQWSIFNDSKLKNTELFLRDVFKDDIEIINELFENKIRLNIDFFEGDEAAEKWKSTSTIIKNEFRFTPKLEIEELENILISHSHYYDKGMLFYRARIVEENHIYKSNEMGTPSLGKATAGRANPKGIPYLYVSTQISTTIHEVRASYFDKIAVGTFILLEPIQIVRFRSYKNKSPFTLDTIPNHKYINFMKYLESELSKPIRRNDSEIEYLPTQYLCEIVKRIGFDGVEYGSSLEDNGINLVLFNSSKLECKKVSVFEIERINIDFKETI